MLTVLATSLAVGAAFAFRPSTVRLKQTVEHLASFPTRNTNTPELVQAAAWVADQMKQIPGLEVETMKYEIKAGSRVPADKEVVQVIGILKGETDHRVLVSGHLDSINMTPGADIFTSHAPGANDDLSGVALVLESARQLAKYKWHNTLVFCVVSGEEQG
ncbi:MAG: M28 family peptidase, partial [Armatimonadota bacterium]